MKHVRRLTRFAFVGLSAAACLLTVALWVRSYHVSDHLAYNTADSKTGRCREYVFCADRGLVRFDRVLRTFDESEGLDMFVHDLPIFDKETLGLSLSQHRPVTYDPDDHSLLARLGFWWDSFDSGSKRIARIRPTTKPVGHMSLSGGHVCLPLWFITLVFSVAPLRRLELFVRRRWRRDASRCPVCGYDLRATPERCPECGSGVEGHAE